MRSKVSVCSSWPPRCGSAVRGRTGVRRGIEDHSAVVSYIHNDVYGLIRGGLIVTDNAGNVISEIESEPEVVPDFDPPDGPVLASNPDYKGAIWRATPNFSSRPASASGKVKMVIIPQLRGRLRRLLGLAGPEEGRRQRPLRGQGGRLGDLAARTGGQEGLGQAGLRHQQAQRRAARQVPYRRSRPALAVQPHRPRSELAVGDLPDEDQHVLRRAATGSDARAEPRARAGPGPGAGAGPGSSARPAAGRPRGDHRRQQRRQQRPAARQGGRVRQLVGVRFDAGLPRQ